MSDVPTPASRMKLEPRVMEAVQEAMDHAAEWARDQARDETDLFISATIDVHKVSSPIERMFLAAFAPYAVMDPSYSIEPQVSVGDYRADFVVTFKAGSNLMAQVVVECDGHDFHEKTKKQAEHDKRRDRFFTSEGYSVMRFTGRELWRDPFACVEEVIDFTQRGLG